MFRREGSLERRFLGRKRPQARFSLEGGPISTPSPR